MALLKTFFCNARFYRTGHNVRRIKQLCRLEACLPEHRNFFTDKCMRDRQGVSTPTLPTDNTEASDKDAKPKIPEPPRTWFAPGEQNYERIKLVGTFVDRSLFLEKLLGPFEDDGTMPYRPVFISAPRRFGKSTILSMVKHFLEIECDQDGVPKKKVNEAVEGTPNYKLFEKMNIMNNKEIVRECLGRHPVIHLDFKAPHFHNYEELLSSCRGLLYDAIKQHAYLDKKLKDNQGNQFIKSWCVENYHIIDEDGVQEGLLLLAEYLYKHFGRKVFILVDEYDAIARQVIDQMHDEEEVKAASELFVNMLRPAIKGGTAYVQGAVLTGISYISAMGFSDGLNNVSIFRFLETHQFTEFYGVVESEVERIVRWYEETHEEENLLETLKECYNGYVTLDGKIRLYSLWSIGNTLEFGKVGSYWINSGNFCYLPDLLKMQEILGYILDLLNDEPITIHVVKRVQLRDVMMLNAISKSPGQLIPNLDLLFSMMLEEGYLSFVKPEENTLEVQGGIPVKQMKAAVKFPNEEIKTHIRYHVRVYFETTWGFDEVRIHACARFFEKVQSFSSAKDDGFKLELEQFHWNLSALFKCFSNEHLEQLNESHLHCLMYHIATVVPFKRGSQYRLYREKEPGETNLDGMLKSEEQVLAGIMDLLMLSNDGFAIIIKLKCNKYGKKDETSLAGLKQILDPKRKYLSVLTDKKSKSYFLLSISIDDQKRPSLSCLLNSQDINCAVHFP